MEPTSAKIPVLDAFHFGWERTRDNLRPLLYLGLTNVLIALGQQAAAPPGTVQPGHTLFALILQILQLCVWLTYVRWALRLCDGAGYALFEAGWLRGLLPFVVTGLLYGLIVCAGLVLFVLPGIFWAVSFSFAGMLVVDQKLDPWSALRESHRITRGVKGRLLGFVVLALLLNALGAAAAGLGMILTVPITLIAQARLLRRLEERARGAGEAQVAPSALSPTPA